MFLHLIKNKNRKAFNHKQLSITPVEEKSKTYNGVKRNLEFIVLNVFQAKLHQIVAEEAFLSSGLVPNPTFLWYKQHFYEF